jgi:hypothetical protein
MSKDYRSYATSEISPTMAAFADFLIAEVYEGKLPADFDEATFRRAVALGGSTRGYFQKSEAWHSDPRNYLANVDANRAAKAVEAAARAEESAKKAAERLAKAKAKAAEAVKAAGKVAEAAKAKAEAAKAA